MPGIFTVGIECRGLTASVLRAEKAAGQRWHRGGNCRINQQGWGNKGKKLTLLDHKSLGRVLQS